LEGEHASRSASEPDSASLRKVQVASLPEKMKPEIDDVVTGSKVIGLAGVIGGSARGQNS